jgi:hypothetical protein
MAHYCVAQNCAAQNKIQRKLGKALCFDGSQPTILSPRQFRPVPRRARPPGPRLGPVAGRKAVPEPAGPQTLAPPPTPFPLPSGGACDRVEARAGGRWMAPARPLRRSSRAPSPARGSVEGPSDGALNRRGPLQRDSLSILIH